MAGRPSGTLAMTITCGGVEGGGFGLRKDLIAGGRCVCTDLRTHHEAGDEHLQRVPAAPDGDGVEDDARGDGEEGDEAHEVEHLHLADACVGMARGRECSLGLVVRLVVSVHLQIRRTSSVDFSSLVAVASEAMEPIIVLSPTRTTTPRPSPARVYM